MSRARLCSTPMRTNPASRLFWPARTIKRMSARVAPRSPISRAIPQPRNTLHSSLPGILSPTSRRPRLSPGWPTYSATPTAISKRWRSLWWIPGSLGRAAQKDAHPLEFLYAAGRIVGRMPEDPGQFLGALAFLGMPLWGPPGPNGFPDMLPPGLAPRHESAARNLRAHGRRWRDFAQPARSSRRDRRRSRIERNTPGDFASRIEAAGVGFVADVPGIAAAMKGARR